MKNDKNDNISSDSSIINLADKCLKLIQNSNLNMSLSNIMKSNDFSLNNENKIYSSPNIYNDFSSTNNKYQSTSFISNKNNENILISDFQNISNINNV